MRTVLLLQLSDIPELLVQTDNLILHESSAVLIHVQILTLLCGLFLFPLSTEGFDPFPPSPLPPQEDEEELYYPVRRQQWAIEEEKESFANCNTRRLVFHFARTVVAFAEPRSVFLLSCSLHDSHELSVQGSPGSRSVAHAIAVRRGPPASLDALSLQWFVCSTDFPTGHGPATPPHAETAAVATAGPEIVAETGTPLL